MVFCFLFFQQEKEGPAGVWGRFPRGAGEMSRSDKGGRRACARPEPPPTPGPRRSDRSYSGEACGFKYSPPPGQGEKPNCGVPAAATQYPWQRHFSDRRERSAFCSPQVRGLRQGLALARAGRKAKPRCGSHRDIVSAATAFPRRSRRAARSAHRRCAVYVKA